MTVGPDRPEGLDFIKRMLPDTNIILESYRPGTMKPVRVWTMKAYAPAPGYHLRFGLRLSGRPGLIPTGRATISLRRLVGRDEHNRQAGGPPIKSGLALGDLVGG